MTIILPRRSFLIGLGAALAAPAIVRASSLMPVRAPRLISPAVVLYNLAGDGVNYTHEWFDGDGKLISTGEGPILRAPFAIEQGKTFSVRVTSSLWRMHHERTFSVGAPECTVSLTT